MKSEMALQIERLKHEKKAVILAHYYQRAEIQEIADFVGDSLALARVAAETEAEVIVFCGVHFMAETAAVLNPGKTVVVPDKNGGCPMADMCDVRELRKVKQMYPEAKVVCYVNSSAEVKSESYICCTSGNAEKVLSSLKSQEPYIFVPDRWLGEWASRKIGRSNLFVVNSNGIVEDMGGEGIPVYLWDGHCPVHHNILYRFAQDIKQKNPDALLCVHPEARNEVTRIADFVGSTAQILNFCENSDAKKFLVGTEPGILHELKKRNPGKEFIPVTEVSVCTDMKLVTLEKLLWALEDLSPVVTVDPVISQKALGSIERMLAL